MAAPSQATTGVGTAAGDLGQAETALLHPLRRSGLRVRSLISLRWLLVSGQSLILLAVTFGLRFSAPLAPCIALILLSAAVNVAVSVSAPHERRAADWEAALQLGFDIIQLSALLSLTGGLANPFSILLVPPVTLAAATLPPRYAGALCAAAFVCTLTLAFWHLPLPWLHGEMFAPPAAYRIGTAIAIGTAMAFSAGYAWSAAREAQRMELALNVTQSVLAREQRLSALGGLAAAAAHELGTPLATISVVAKELMNDAPDDVKDDARLLYSQAERCRDILRRLTEEPDTSDAVHERLSLTQFLNEVIEPHANASVRVEAVVSGAPGVRAPDIRRMPEVLHAMTSFVENAVDFASSEVLVSARFDAESLIVEVRDDGPGFSPDIMARLGQPYITSRPNESYRSGHTGMGLGFFISKTLLERTGAVVDFQNGKRGGAVVWARWPRAAIEAPPLE